METLNRTARPFNLSFACMAAPIKELNGRIFEQSKEFNWHPNMLIDGTPLHCEKAVYSSSLVLLRTPIDTNLRSHNFK
ncbi:SidA/IucD/PvdA family monooxygenase [Marinomonas sp. TW1]|uniref:SidA/IucD/PvdA family monooxygenase n=1 Tax=Marinomonas sp. TW1 TaxID=1561203 RepID=UPI000AB4DBD1